VAFPDIRDVTRVARELLAAGVRFRSLAASLALLSHAEAHAQLPDLTASILNVAIQLNATVGGADVAEGCASSTSGVDLLRFGLSTANVGAANFVLGDPACVLPCNGQPCGNPDFVCSPADGHNHGHYTNYVSYELLDAGGDTVVRGRKQGFCLRDTDCASPVYTCAYQGLSAGCTDTYVSSLGCQYLEITGVPPGPYVLRVVVDPLDQTAEANEGNNVTTRPVTVPPRNGTATTTTTTSTLPASTTTVARATTSTVTSTTLPSVGVTQRVSVASDGSEASQASIHPALSLDGRFVVFESRAAELAASDTNGLADVFLHDRTTGAIERISVAANGSEARGSSERPSVSADGRYVVFTSNAANLVVGDTNLVADVFVRDRTLATTSRVSVAPDGREGDAESRGAVVSADGRMVAFESNATTLVPGHLHGFGIVVRDLQTGVVALASIASDGTHADADSSHPALSADGRFVAFESQATNLVPGDTNQVSDVFLHDRLSETTTRVSVASDGTQADGDSFLAALSADGSVVVFESRASNLVAGDTNATSDVFVHDRTAATTTRVSVGSDGAQADRPSYLAAVSGHGQTVAFTSEATTLVPGDVNGVPDVFVHERGAATTARVSLAGDGQEADAPSLGGALSLDGAVLAFESEATNLVAGDTNGVADVFVHERRTVPVSCAADSDCTDRPPCTTSRCAGGQCSVVKRGGLDGILCGLSLGINADLCGAEALPRGLQRSLDRTLAKIHGQLVRLEQRTPGPARVGRTVERIDRRLGRLDHRLARAARRERISLDCHATARLWLGEVRAAIAIVRP
jgi:Tol biopolymer transport system component